MTNPRISLSAEMMWSPFVPSGVSMPSNRIDLPPSITVPPVWSHKVGKAILGEIIPATLNSMRSAPLVALVAAIASCKEINISLPGLAVKASMEVMSPSIVFERVLTDIDAAKMGALRAKKQKRQLQKKHVHYNCVLVYMFVNKLRAHEELFRGLIQRNFLIGSKV